MTLYLLAVFCRHKPATILLAGAEITAMTAARQLAYTRSQLLNVRRAPGSKSKVHVNDRRPATLPRRPRASVYQHDLDQHVGRVQRVYISPVSPRPSQQRCQDHGTLITVKRVAPQRSLTVGVLKVLGMQSAR